MEQMYDLEWIENRINKQKTCLSFCDACDMQEQLAEQGIESTIVSR